MDTRYMRTRVKGRPALVRRLRGLLTAVHRFGRCRAATREDQFWTARMIDALETALQTAEARRHNPPPVSVEGQTP